MTKTRLHIRGLIKVARKGREYPGTLAVMIGVMAEIQIRKFYPNRNKPLPRLENLTQNPP